MEDHDASGSLFEGMDFVLSAAPEQELAASGVELAPSKGAHRDADNQFAPASLQRLASEPLDEDLFTGLSMLTAGAGGGESVESGDAKTGVSAAVERRGLEHFLAGSKVAKSGRKKKRSLRIGYGREIEDSEDREATSIEAVDDAVHMTEFEAALVDGEDARISISHSEISKQESEPDLSDLDGKDVTSDEKEVEKEALVEELSNGTTGAEVELETSEATLNPEATSEAEDNETDHLERISTMTIEGRLVMMKQEIARKLQDLETKAAEASASRKIAAQIRREAAVVLSAAAAKRKDLEVDLENACEREDFELADRLSQDVAEAEKSLELADTACKEAEVNYDLAAANMEEIVTLKISIEEDGAAALEELQTEAEAAAEDVKTVAAETARKLNESLRIQEKNIDMKNTDYELQLRALEEAKSELDKTVNEAIQPEVLERDCLLAERQVLVDELQELLEKVRAKESEISKRDKSLEEIEVKIAGVTGNFEDDQLTLESDIRNISSRLEELAAEASGLQAARREAEENAAAAEVECQELKKSAASAASEAGSLREALERRRKVALFSRDIKQKKLQLVKKEEELLAEAQALRQQATTARTSLQSLSSTKVRLQQEISSAKQKIVYLEKRGPELEAEKRLAAAARNFKEAARLSAEAKALLAEKEGATKDVEKRNAELEKLEEEIEAKIVSLEDVEGLIGVKEKEAAKTCCERLRLVAVAARDERDVAIDLDDFEEAECLETEAAAADAEADELQRIHQFEVDCVIDQRED